MKKYKKGFTVIELLVAIAVITLLSSIPFFGYRVFSNKVALAASVQDMALSIRQAQTNALSAKESSPGSGNFNSGQGVYFDITDPTSYYIFVDKNGNGKYDVGSGCGSSNTECISQNKISNGVTMSSFCGMDLAGNNACPPTNSRALTILFTRPNPDALIQFTDSSGNIISNSYRGAQISLGLSGGVGGSDLASNMSFYQNGQISVGAVAVIPTEALSIANLSPTYGPAGTAITLTGSGFDSSGNVANVVSELTILMNGVTPIHVLLTSIPNINSSNGTSLSFTFPTNNCSVGPRCLTIAPGNYNISITNSKGTSNSVVFYLGSQPPLQQL